MDTWIIALIVLGLMVVVGGGAFVAVRSRGRDLELYQDEADEIDVSARLDDVTIDDSPRMTLSALCS